MAEENRAMQYIGISNYHGIELEMVPYLTRA